VIAMCQFYFQANQAVRQIKQSGCCIIQCSSRFVLKKKNHTSTEGV
jgi:hypothetical protein